MDNQTNKISKNTRNSIFEIISNFSIGDIEFLNSLYDLNKLPSKDYRYTTFYDDICKHTVSNYDWEDNWWRSDNRLNLIGCSDTEFSRFLDAVIKWFIKPKSSEDSTLKSINEELNYDGFMIFNISPEGKRPEYIIKEIDASTELTIKNSLAISQKIDSEYIIARLSAISSSIGTDPYLSIGTAKELVETVLKYILDDYEIAYNLRDDMPKLLAKVNECLDLVPQNISNLKKGHESIRKILGNFVQIVHGIAELRNDYGAGHGRHKDFKGLTSRHAKLCLNAATAVIVFLMDTHEIKYLKA